jgi:hypothetical protein
MKYIICSGSTCQYAWRYAQVLANSVITMRASGLLVLPVAYWTGHSTAASWWASRKPMWDINLIHLGLIDQWRAIVNAYRAVNTSGADGNAKGELHQKLVTARDLRNKIADRLFIL